MCVCVCVCVCQRRSIFIFKCTNLKVVYRITLIVLVIGKAQFRRAMLSCDSSCFCSSRIRTLVAMATYSSHRLKMGKEEIDNFFYLIGDILNFFYRNVY